MRRLVRAKELMENNGQCFASLDEYEETKAYLYKAQELVSLSKTTYVNLCEEAIHSAKRCIEKLPESKPMLSTFITQMEEAIKVYK